VTRSNAARGARFRRYGVPTALALLAVWHALLLSVWLKKDTRPPQWDQSVHLSTALRFKNALARGRIGEILRAAPSPGHPPYPPAAMLAMTAGMVVGGPLGAGAEDAAVFAAGFSALAVLALGAYLFVAPTGGPWGGVAAACLTTLAPPVLSLSRQPLVDLTLAAWVVLAYGLWRSSEGFSRYRPTVALGAAAGVGLLVKWTWPLYVLPILGAAGTTFFVRRKNKRKISLAALLAAGLPAPWYFANLAIVAPKLARVAGLGAQEGDPSASSLAGWFYYPGVLWEQWTPAWLLAGLAGLGWAFLRHRKVALSLAGWLATGLVFWSLVPNKDPRYILPAALALPLAASLLPSLFPGGLALAAAAFSVWIVGSPAGARFAAGPSEEAWPLESMAARAAALTPADHAPAVLTLIANHPHMNGNNMTWTVAKERLGDRINVRTKLDRLGQFTEFVLVKTGDLGPAPTVTKQAAAREQVMDPGGWFRGGFEEAGRWPLPDGSEGILFQRAAKSVPLSNELGPAAMLPGLMDGLSLEGFQGTLEPSVRYPGHSVCRLATERLTFGPVALGQVRLVLDGLLLAKDAAGQPRVLDLRRLELESARWSAEDADRFLAARADFLRNPRVEFLEGNRVEVQARLGFVPLGVQVEVQSVADPEPALRLRVVRWKVGGVPLPRVLLGPWRTRRLSLVPTGRLPFEISLDGLRTVPAEPGGRGALEVGTP